MKRQPSPFSLKLAADAAQMKPKLKLLSRDSSAGTDVVRVEYADGAVATLIVVSRMLTVPRDNPFWRVMRQEVVARMPSMAA